MKVLARTVLCAIFTFSAAYSGSAAADGLTIADSAELTKPLQAGERAPAFTVYRVDGTQFDFNPAALERPALIITFRGGWCPYCNAQLAGLRSVLPEISKRGMDVLFLSGDRPELLYSSLKAETQESIAGLDYQILSDANMQAASAFGIAFKVPAETAQSFKERGRDIGNSSIALHQALPVPAVFVIDTEGMIKFSYANPDYKIRLPAEEVKAAAEPLLAKE
jgi:peroxiredoxin